MQYLLPLYLFSHSSCPLTTWCDNQAAAVQRCNDRLLLTYTHHSCLPKSTLQEILYTFTFYFYEKSRLIVKPFITLHFVSKDTLIILPDRPLPISTNKPTNKSNWRQNWSHCTHFYRACSGQCCRFRVKTYLRPNSFIFAGL